MSRIHIVHLKDGVLDDFDAVDDVSNEENQRDDHEGDQGGVAQVLHIDVLILVVQLQTSRGKVEIVPIVSVPVVCHKYHIQINPKLTIDLALEGNPLDFGAVQVSDFK